MRTKHRPYPFLPRSSCIRLPHICCAAIALAVSTATHASLIPTVFVDTETQLVILWDWDEFSGSGSHGAGLPVGELNMPPLVNWEVTLTTFPVEPLPTWTVAIEVRHIFDPHPGDAGGGVLAILTKEFDDNLFLGLPVLPNVFAGAAHPAVGHSDDYEMQVFHSATGTTNTIKLFGEHIPEPSTLGLLGLSGLMLARRRSSRRRL